ncbi:MAG: hypothetical protein P8P30_06360 [Rickettsiales bacterium]|nr:hypothetical protein [Rickettsiales bacterium]
MRKLIFASATLLLLSGCNTVDGFAKDMGAIGQSFAGMFDGTVQNSRRIRDNSDYVMNGNNPPPMQRQGGGYGGGGGGYAPPMGGGYGGGGGMGAMPPQFPPYQQPQQYQQQPRQPAMPYYYNEGY